MHTYIHTCIHTYIHYTCIHYIYREREIERERDLHCIHTPHMYI